MTTTKPTTPLIAAFTVACMTGFASPSMYEILPSYKGVSGVLEIKIAPVAMSWNCATTFFDYVRVYAIDPKASGRSLSEAWPARSAKPACTS